MASGVGERPHQSELFNPSDHFGCVDPVESRITWDVSLRYRSPHFILGQSDLLWLRWDLGISIFKSSLGASETAKFSKAWTTCSLRLLQF